MGEIVTASRGGRLCVVCSHVNRDDIETELASGEVSIRGVAGHWKIAPESMRRHVRTHVDPALLEATLALRGIPALDVLARLLELAEFARDLRLSAEERGDDRLALQAHRAEERTLALLSERLGVNKLPTADLMRTMNESLAEAAGVVQIVARVARTRPDVGMDIAGQIEQLGLPDLAGVVRDQAAKGRALFLETTHKEPNT